MRATMKTSAEYRAITQAAKDRLVPLKEGL
jgi:hypothetical protein